jgi:hypothetical protein
LLSCKEGRSSELAVVADFAILDNLTHPVIDFDQVIKPVLNNLPASY